MNLQSTAHGAMTSAEIDFFSREGYLMPARPLFPEPKFNALRQHFEEKLARLPADVNPESMDVPHFTDPKLFEWLFADEVLDLIEPIIGPDIALFSSHFIAKPAGTGRRVPWHEDSAYWQRMMHPHDVVTVWLAIDPSTRANGCMKVIPRTHAGTGGFSEYEPRDINTHMFAAEIKRSQLDESKAVYLELQPNQCSLHHAKLMHASDPNTSDIRRCGYTMRFMSTRVKLNDEYCGAFHQIYLARGRDHAGNRYADAAQSYPHLARFRETSGPPGGH
jgi:chlorinating enzyme